MTGSDRDARKRFAANIERLRRREGLSLGQLAERSQIDRVELGQILRGDRDPGAGAIYMIAGALAVDPGDLFEGVSWDPPLTGGPGYRIDDPEGD